MIFDKKIIDGPKSQQIFDRLRRKAITKPSRDALERDVTVEEVEKTMENLPTGKQAGPNRVPNAVYKYMSAAFAPKLTEILNESTAIGKLPGHFLEGDISMLFKKKYRKGHSAASTQSQAEQVETSLTPGCGKLRATILTS